MPPPKLKPKATDSTFRFRVDGVTYAVDRNEITPRIERELFAQANVTPQQAIQALTGGALFGVAAVVFMARRQAGEAVGYQQIEDRLWKAYQDAGDEFDLTVIEDGEEDGEVSPPE